MKLTKTLKNKDSQMKKIRVICTKIHIEIDMPVHITMKHCPLSNLWSGCNLSEWTFMSCCLHLAFVNRAYQEKSSSSYSFCCCGDVVLPPYNFPLPYSFDLNSLLSPADHVGAQVILLVLVHLPLVLLSKSLSKYLSSMSSSTSPSSSSSTPGQGDLFPAQSFSARPPLDYSRQDYPRRCLLQCPPALITPRQDYTLCCLHPDTVCSASSSAVLHHCLQQRYICQKI